MSSNIGMTNSSIAVTMTQHEHGDHDRVRHRRLHLAAQLDLLLDRVGEAQQHAVERTADLTGACTIAT